MMFTNVLISNILVYMEQKKNQIWVINYNNFYSHRTAS